MSHNPSLYDDLGQYRMSLGLSEVPVPKARSKVDRFSPTLRPQMAASGFQKWRDLLFMHWEVPVEQLRKIVPPELEIDTFGGRGYVALVPFRMRETRPKWLPKSFALNFLETNVRTYVTYRDQPGVYFFSLDASSRLAVWAARAGWALPYYFAHMKGSNHCGNWTYSCNRLGVKSRVEFQLSGKLSRAKPDTLEHFLLERYLLFVKRRGQVFVGQVHHAPYQYTQAQVVSLRDRLLPEAGLELGDRQPELAHYSPGVDVEVFRIVPA